MSRDYQRSKIYRAERLAASELDGVYAEASDPFATIAELSEHFGIKPPRVEINHALKSHAGQYRPWSHLIEFQPRPSRKTVGHEFAHALTSGSKHRAWFAEGLIKVQQHYIGSAYAGSLVRQFEKVGVLYTQKAEFARAERLRTQVAASQMEDGASGKAYALYRLDGKWLATDPQAKGRNYTTTYVSGAKVYRRLATAEAKQAIVRQHWGKSWAIQKVDVEYRQGKWEPVRLV